MIWLLPWTPRPQRPTTLLSSLLRYLIPVAPAAPVLRAVTYVPSMMARGRPFSGLLSTMRAITAGRPWACLFPGCTVTSLVPAAPRPGMYAGIAMRTPLSKWRYTLAGISMLSLPISLKALSTASNVLFISRTDLTSSWVRYNVKIDLRIK